MHIPGKDWETGGYKRVYSQGEYNGGALSWLKGFRYSASIAMLFTEGNIESRPKNRSFQNSGWRYWPWEKAVVWYIRWCCPTLHRRAWKRPCSPSIGRRNFQCRRRVKKWMRESLSMHYRQRKTPGWSWIPGRFLHFHIKPLEERYCFRSAAPSADQGNAKKMRSVPKYAQNAHGLSADATRPKQYIKYIK